MSVDPYDKIEQELHRNASTMLSYVRASARGDTEIERLFYTALRSFINSGSAKNTVGMLDARDMAHLEQLMADEAYHYRLLVLPQAQVAGWRTDFLICAIQDGHAGKSKWRKVIVECDGHDFHERTKEQAAKDRSRDREAQMAGIHILRFTGSELWRDAWGCAEKVCEWAFRVQFGEI